MEDDTELISDMLRNNAYVFHNVLQQTPGPLLQPQTSISSGGSRRMASYTPLSLSADQLLPSETSWSSQSLHHGSTIYGERHFGMDSSCQLGSNCGGYEGSGNETGLYACSPGNIKSGMDLSPWPETLQNCVELDQYAQQLDSLFGCSSTYTADNSALPTTPDTQNFELPPQMRDSAVPRSSLECPTPATVNASLPPVSPADSMQSCAPTSDTQLRSSDNNARSVPDVSNFGFEDDTDADSGSSEEPYARLIFRALMSVPGHKMALKDIYDWFKKHTNKAKNSDTKGWQNSIRHNLSMNAAFEGGKETTSSDGSPKKSPNVWILTEEAIKNGVQSTTRFRKQVGSKKSHKSEHPAPQRQRSGAKGGRAAKKSARTRRAVQGSPKGEHGLLAAKFTSGPHHDLCTNYTTTVAEYRAPSIATPRVACNQYDISRIFGCSTLPLDGSIFYQNGGSDGHIRMTDFPISTDQALGPNFNGFQV